MPEDEPLDDLQAVGLTAAASAARVAEVLARNAQEQRERQQQNEQRTEAQQIEDATVRQAVLRDQADLTKAEQWARTARPEFLEANQRERLAADTGNGRHDVERALVAEWKSTDPAYDSPERRSITEQYLERQGVPAEAREARVKSDLMNGRDPQLAASQGAALRTQQRRSVAQPERVRGR